jgi:arylsulfatase A-like enzyme
VDIVPTLCDYAGIEPPPHMRGFSLRPLVEGRDVPWRGHVVAEVAPTNAGRMVRSNRYKYITYSDRPNLGEEFYDMQADPWEMNNLIANATAQPAIADHRRILADWESHLIKLPIPPMPPRTRPAAGPAR